MPDQRQDKMSSVPEARELPSGLPEPAAEDIRYDNPEERPARTLWGDAVYRMKRNRLAVFSLTWIIIIMVVSLTADLWAPQLLGHPTEIDTTKVVEQALKPPSLEHPMGTDQLGRDVAVRVIYGSRYSLAVGVVATAISLAIGLALGAFAAYYKGVADSLVMRMGDVFLAFPYILFSIALIMVLGRGLTSLFIAIGFLGWPTIARVIRSSMFSVQENDYIDAARAMGASDLRIIGRHILPNSMAPVIVYTTMTIGGAILAEAALSFLGLGVQPPAPSWGGMLSQAQNYMTSAPWIMLFPGFAILTTVLAFVLLGDGFRDAFDVKMKD